MASFALASGGTHIVHMFDVFNCKKYSRRLDELVVSLNQTVHPLYFSNLKAPKSEKNSIYEQFLCILVEVEQG